ncbi:MAG: hypothetical protein ACW976_07775 [Candidatus Ranarchaeia archaeon]|jgi:hypothetical protein
MLQILSSTYSQLHILFLFVWCIVGGLIGYRLFLSRAYSVDMTLILTGLFTALTWVFLPFGELNLILAFLVSALSFRFLKKVIVGKKSKVMGWDKALLLLLALTMIVAAYVIDYLLRIILAAIPL